MINSKIEKANLLCEELSVDALHLARAIYNTYIENNFDLSMEIKLSVIYNLLNLQPSNDSLKYIKSVLIELNEPVCVKNFKYKNKIYNMRFVAFCTYSFSSNSIELELSEEFLEVEANYMLDSFLTN